LQYTVQVSYTPAIVRSGIRRFWLRFAGRDTALGAIGLAASSFGWVVLGYRTWLVGCFMAVSGFLFVLSLLVFVTFRTRSLRKLRAMPAPTAAWTFTEESLSTETQLAQSKIAWSLVKKLWRFPDVWVLVYSRSDYSLLPVSDIPSEVQAFIVERVRANGGKVA
jgi:hypothetical protein